MEEKALVLCMTNSTSGSKWTPGYKTTQIVEVVTSQCCCLLMQA